MSAGVSTLAYLLQYIDSCTEHKCKQHQNNQNCTENGKNTSADSHFVTDPLAIAD